MLSKPYIYVHLETFFYNFTGVAPGYFTLVTDKCGYLDCDGDHHDHHQSWKAFHDFPKRLYNQAAVVVKHKGEDYAWFVSGGICKCF